MSEPPRAAEAPPDSAAPAALEAAIRRYEERLLRDPASLGFAALADLYAKAGRPADAIARCRAGLERYPHYTPGRLALARALAIDGRPDEALVEVDAVLALSPKDPEAHRLAAELHRRAARLEPAIAHLEAIAALDPGDREARLILGVLRASPDPDRAPGPLARVLRDDTFVTEAFAALCLEQGLHEEAGQVYARLLRRDPDNPRARAGLEQALRGRARRKG